MASLKENLRRIPVLGYLLRWISNIVLLPRRIAALQQLLGAQETQMRQMQERSAALETQINMLENRETREYFQKRLHEVEADCGEMNRLRSVLSGHSAVWGDPARLHIADTAAVVSCLFNTNSGSITVGDYTFSGSNVSLLAGSHDMNLTGLLRRDTQLNEGCDIVVGRGVWLASGCTLLGPCTVGDNAVIAAGSIVLPGTAVPPNAVYAGIPAHAIKDLGQQEDFLATGRFLAGETDGAAGENTAVGRALRRCGGTLFTAGWNQAEDGCFLGETRRGHWMREKEAVLYRRWGAERVLRLPYFYSPGAKKPVGMKVEVLAGKELLAASRLQIDGQAGDLELSVPNAKEGQVVCIRLTLDELWQPSAVFGSPDGRYLGLFISVPAQNNRTGGAA